MESNPNQRMVMVANSFLSSDPEPTCKLWFHSPATDPSFQMDLDSKPPMLPLDETAPQVESSLGIGDISLPRFAEFRPLA